MYFAISVQIFVRALFDYDPSTDDLISCREAGLAFSAGDILHILAKDDHHWWQARHWVSDNISQTLQLAGLIPSPELVEWKTSCSTIERAKRKHTAKIGGRLRDRVSPLPWTWMYPCVDIKLRPYHGYICRYVYGVTERLK